MGLIAPSARARSEIGMADVGGWDQNLDMGVAKVVEGVGTLASISTACESP
jgi:hypothetical protein